MKKILAIGASNSKNSINKTLANYAASLIEDAAVDTLDLGEFEMPIYSIDREQEGGIPEAAKQFKSRVEEADGIVVSLAEHNGNYTAAFKNILDWVSRAGGKIWADKPMILLATSPGARGGITALDIAANTFPYQGAQVTSKFSLPSYYDNFDGDIKDQDLKNQFKENLKAFENTLSEINA